MPSSQCRDAARHHCSHSTSNLSQNSLTPEFVHPTAIVESDSIGSGTRIWAFVHILPGVQIGTDCNIGDHAFMESGALIGNNVTVKNGVCIWEGVTIEDDCFVGPSVVFTNDQFPRSPRMGAASSRYQQRQNWLERTVVEQGCSIGANATICPGIRLGAYSMIGAGATVTNDVKPHALMIGTPARQIGFVCLCGSRINDADPQSCSQCGTNLTDLIF